MHRYYLLFVILACSNVVFCQDSLFIEAESFDDLGGWVIDQQSWEVIGSSYIMAHGNGELVDDAKTKVDFPEKGVVEPFQIITLRLMRCRVQC